VAVGTATVSLHGPSRAAWCGAYGPQNFRLQSSYAPDEAYKRHGADDAAMRAITLAQVSAACDELLARHTTRQCG
jgi:hypothetical protein